MNRILKGGDGKWRRVFDVEEIMWIKVKIWIYMIYVRNCEEFSLIRIEYRVFRVKSRREEVGKVSWG